MIQELERYNKGRHKWNEYSSYLPGEPYESLPLSEQLAVNIEAGRLKGRCNELLAQRGRYHTEWLALISGQIAFLGMLDHVGRSEPPYLNEKESRQYHQLKEQVRVSPSKKLGLYIRSYEKVSPPEAEITQIMVRGLPFERGFLRIVGTQGYLMRYDLRPRGTPGHSIIRRANKEDVHQFAEIVELVK